MGCWCNDVFANWSCQGIGLGKGAGNTAVFATYLGFSVIQGLGLD